ncbi:MAG: DUF4623 domain-containing protein [Dysgonomonas sp.]
MNNLIKYIGLLIVPFCLMVSCDNDEKYPDTTADETVIYNIKIVNGGLSGTETIVGVVDEDKKEISFPEVHIDSDLSHVKFEIEASERAYLDATEYNFVMEEGLTQRRRIIKLLNGTRFREYYVTIRLDVPVWGADFTKAVAYGFSAATKNIYPDLAAASTRAAHMDKDYVLMVSRDGGTRPHLLKISDLKQGKADSPIMLKTISVPGSETFAVSGGRLSHGHIYICNLASSPADIEKPLQTLKIYHWDTPTSEPKCLYQSELLRNTRYGDFMSVNLDESGNGYIFVSNSPSPSALLRLKVVGFTTISEPTYVSMPTYAGSWQSYNQVGYADEYIYTGHQAPIILANANGEVIHTVPTTKLAAAKGSDACIINFNKERYLVVNEVPGIGTITIYDLTQGDTTADALKKIEEGDLLPLLSYSLGGAVAATTAAGNIGWFADGDNKLYIFGAAPGAGFAILEVPKKVKESK